MPRAKVESTNKRRRVPVSGQRDILAVLNKDPNKHYRWVKAANENGMRIFKFKQAGYEFSDPTETGLIVGEDLVSKSRREDGGSVISYQVENDKNGSPQYLYLMETKKEWYEEDQQLKQAELAELEDSMIRRNVTPDDNELGQYGNVKIERRRGK